MSEIHPPRNPQPPRWLRLTGLFGILFHNRGASTLSRFRSYYTVSPADERLVVEVVMMSCIQGEDEHIKKAKAVEVVDELAEQYNYGPEEIRALALRVRLGTELDPDFQADDGAREVGERIRKHVDDWFLKQKPATPEELAAVCENYFGYNGEEDFFQGLAEGPHEHSTYSDSIVFPALLSNYWTDEVEKERVNPDDLLPEQRTLLNDAGISTWSSIAKPAL